MPAASSSSISSVVGEHVIVLLVHRRQPRALLALDEHADRAVGQLQQLQHLGDGADIVEVVAVGLVAALVELRDEQDVLVAGHRRLERRYRLVSPDEQRHHLAREHNQVAQGEQGKGIHLYSHPSIRNARASGMGAARILLGIWEAPVRAATGATNSLWTAENPTLRLP